MKRDRLNDMAVFVEVARCGGFRAAATALNIGAGSVSEAIRRFEDRLGVRLFERSTRSIALTSAGETLYRRSLPAMDELESALRDLDEFKECVSGTLRLSAPRSAGPFFLDNLIAGYSTLFPGVAIELIYDDRKVDLVTARIDAAVRSQNLLEQDTHAVPIGPELRMVVVGAPDYFQRHGRPATPSELIDHDGICFAFDSADRVAPWTFEGENGVYTVMPKPRMIANDLNSMLRFAEAGLGLAYVYAEPAQALIREKKLISILDGATPILPRYTINYLSKRHMPARLRAFIDLARKSV